MFFVYNKIRNAMQWDCEECGDVYDLYQCKDCKNIPKLCALCHGEIKHGIFIPAFFSFCTKISGHGQPENDPSFENIVRLHEDL